MGSVARNNVWENARRVWIVFFAPHRYCCKKWRSVPRWRWPTRSHESKDPLRISAAVCRYGTEPASVDQKVKFYVRSASKHQARQKATMTPDAELFIWGSFVTHHPLLCPNNCKVPIPYSDINHTKHLTSLLICCWLFLQITIERGRFFVAKANYY